MSKTLKHLYSEVLDSSNLFAAYRLARAGKGDRHEVALFDLNLESELLQLQYDLEQGVYQRGEYRQRLIYERKPRVISIAPFRDRVLHHALMNVLDPHLDKTMIPDSFACRRGKGVHRAVDRYQYFAKRFAYVMKLDIKKYFASIDHAILRRLLQRKIADRKVMRLITEIIGSYQTQAGKGLPIGNLTSQFFANYYLNGFDHWVKQSLGVKGYFRYVDDFFVFSNDKSEAWNHLREIEQALKSLEIELHPNKTHLCRTSERIDVLGYLVAPDKRWLRNDNGHRFTRRLVKNGRSWRSGKLSRAKLNCRVRSWIGHAVHGETAGLRRAIFGRTVL